MKPASSLPGAAIAVLFLLSAPAMGQSLAPPSLDEDRWRFSITPYLFLPVTTTGTSTVAGQDVDLDLNLTDVLKVLNGAVSGRVEAWRGDFGLAVEGSFVAHAPRNDGVRRTTPGSKDGAKIGKSLQPLDRAWRRSTIGPSKSKSGCS